jgi:hypothetical protein
MSEEESEERGTPPARIDHEFQKPIVKERPRETLGSARESTDPAKGDKSERAPESTANNPVSSGRHRPTEHGEPG